MLIFKIQNLSQMANNAHLGGKYQQHNNKTLKYAVNRLRGSAS